jgi:hypothetical protein
MSMANHQYNRSVDTGSMPDRIRRLPVSSTGFTVPWFVTWFKDGEPCKSGDGLPDFRVADTRKMSKAIKQHLCWVCGDPVGVYKCFVIGPMCAINRIISEPPSHRECAIYSAMACPFLSKPNMVRNEKNMWEGGVEAAGFGLKRNPGAVCVWITKTYQIFHPHAGSPGILFSLGRPVEVLWFAEGRRATHRVWLSDAAGSGPAGRPRRAGGAQDAARGGDGTGAGPMTPQEIHNRDVGEIVRAIIKPTLDAGGEFTDVLVMLESVILGVMLFAVKTGGDELVLDNWSTASGRGSPSNGSRTRHRRGRRDMTS